MSKPPNTLLDRPVHRDWAVWVALAVAAAMLWQVVGIYLRTPDIWKVLGDRGASTALFMEFLITAMAATTVGVVLTCMRRAVRKLWFRRQLRRNVEFLTPASSRNGETSLARPSDGAGSSPQLVSDRRRFDGIREQPSDPRVRQSPIAS